MNMGGICIGCTMPGFPDKFSPIYERAPGALLSTNTNRVVGGFIRSMRQLSHLVTLRKLSHATNEAANHAVGIRR